MKEPLDNNMRRRMGLDPLCLKCSKAFPSKGIHNRLCDPCREENNELVEEAPWLFTLMLEPGYKGD